MAGVRRARSPAHPENIKWIETAAAAAAHSTILTTVEKGGRFLAPLFDLSLQRPLQELQIAVRARG
jgi:hypothetical protein